MASEKHNMADISPERLALLLDRMDITDVLCRYGSIIDRCSVDQSDATLALLADCLTGDVEVDYGVGGMHKGLDAWIAFVEQSAPRMGRTLHLYTNFLINVDGDTAHAVFNVQVSHTWERERVLRVLITCGTFENDLRSTVIGMHI